MKWPTFFRDIIFKIRSSDDADFDIIDGEIIPKNRDDFRQIRHEETPAGISEPLQSSSSVEPESRQNERIYLPAIPHFHKSYLVDSEANGDLGLFYAWLQRNRYKSLEAYVKDLRAWKSALHGEIDAAEILRVIGGYGITRGRRLIGTLKLYGQYRYDYGDPRVLIILAVTERDIRGTLVSPSKLKFDVPLPPGELIALNEMAKSFVNDGNRVGAWIGLMMRGVPASAVESIEFLGHQRIKFRKWSTTGEGPIPAWLEKALTIRISEKLWRVGRITIRNKVKMYKHPTVLYRNADAAMKVLGE